MAAVRNWEETNIQLLLDSAVTQSAIQAAIERIGSVADADDVVLFFFSGHGTTGRDVAPLDEADGVDEYLCAYGSTLSQYIRDDELSEWLGALPTTNVAVILDTCFSGGQIKVEGGTVKALPSTPIGVVQKGDGFAADLTHRMAQRDMDDNPGCVVLTAADDDEGSYEFSFLKMGCSLTSSSAGWRGIQTGMAMVSSPQRNSLPMPGRESSGSGGAYTSISTPRYTTTIRPAIPLQGSWERASVHLPACSQRCTGRTCCTGAIDISAQADYNIHQQSDTGQGKDPCPV